MGRLILRVVAALAAGALLTVGTAPAANGLTSAAARDYCSPGDTNSVTVVVDFGPFGGVDIRCASLWSGATGADAMAAVGFDTVGTQADGPGFVCRINGEPAAEQCVETPPTSAYWSYWKASPGGGWGYASGGFLSSRVKLGGFEGWSFGSGGAPGVDPVLPAAPEPEPEPEPQPQEPQPQEPAAQPAEQPAAPEQDAPAADAGISGAGLQAAPEAAEAGTVPGDTAAVAAAAEASAQSVAAAEAAAEAAAIEAAAAEAAAEAAAIEAAASEAAAAQAAAESAAALAAQSAAASSAASAAATSSAGRPSSSQPTTSSAASSALSSSEDSPGSTIWFSVIGLLAAASLGTAAVVMSRRRRALSGDGPDDDQAG